MLHATLLSNTLRNFLANYGSADSAPDEIYGARDRGCLPGDDYLYQGVRYVHDLKRDALVREDLANPRIQN
jgi:hypothetical protein